MIRCIFRTEVGATDGRPAMLDWKGPLHLHKANVLDVLVKNTGSVHGRSMALSAEGGADRSKSEALCGKLTLRDGTPWSCAPHKWYILPEYPFQGMWAASRAQLDAFMRHPFWKEENALKANISYSLGYPERSNGMNLFINVEPGLISACAVPIVLKKRFPHRSPEAVGLLAGEVSLAPVSPGRPRPCVVGGRWPRSEWLGCRQRPPPGATGGGEQRRSRVGTGRTGRLGIVSRPLPGQPRRAGARPGAVV